MSSLLRERGTSAGKKYDGECRREITTVSDLRDKGWGSVPLMSGEALLVSAAAPGPAASYRNVTAAVLWHREDSAFSTHNTHYAC